MTVQDRLRVATGGLMSQLGKLVWSWGIHPDTITITGCLLAVVASFFIARGQLQLAGVILLFSLPLDALDGAVARAMHQPNRKFGGVLDSTLDRFADGMIFGTLILYYASNGQPALAAVSLFALIGAFTTSYVRSRAGLAGVEVKIGMIDRLWRVILVLIGLFLSSMLPFIIFVLAVAGIMTTLQRLMYARQHME